MSTPNNAIRFAAEVLRHRGFATIDGTFRSVGPAFDHPIRTLVIQNLTDQLLIFSFDGNQDHLALNAGSTFILDIASNRNEMSTTWSIAQNSFIYVADNGVAPASGDVWVSAFYGKS